jgi:predicted nucleotidyltransferase
MDVAPEIRAEIEERLRAVEREHGVRVLYACESGSRAWGFASPDSDYDVRFLYVHPRDWYLSLDLERRRDVIETPLTEVWDVNGWDLRKALRLYRKTNPPLYEWLLSPIVYRETGPLAARLRDLAATFYNPVSARYHYLHMATGNFRGYLKKPEVPLKKYLYVLRPLLAVLWIAAGQGVVPTEFERLVDGIVTDEALREEIRELLARKRRTSEVGTGPAMPRIQAFLEEELARQTEAVDAAPRPRGDTETLDALFREVLADEPGGADASIPG